MNLPPAAKLHAIYLESHDEITSIIDQIRSVPDEVIAIVAAERSGLLQSLVNLKLLQRNSTLQNKQILLVSPDPVVAALAKQIGILVFPKLDAAKRHISPESATPEEATESVTDAAPADVPEATAPDQNYEKQEIKHATFGLDRTAHKFTEKIAETTKILPNLFTRPDAGEQPKTMIQFNSRPLAIVTLVFILVFLAIGLYAANTILPYARITLVPKTEEFSLEIEALASEKVTEVNYFTKELPASYYETSEELESAAKATEEVQIGAQARGIVSIYNKGYSKAFSLPAGTEVTSYNGQVFQLAVDITVPGLLVEGGQTYPGTKNQVEVIAREPGEEYNIEKDNFSIAGYDTNLVWGESYETFSGGEKHDAIVIGQADIDTLRTKLLTDLTTTSREKLQAQLREGQQFIDGSLQDRIMEEIITSGGQPVSVGAEVSEFSMKIRMQSRGIAFAESQLREMVEKELNMSIPAELEPLTEQQWEITYTVTNFDYDIKQLAIKCQGKGFVAHRISTPTLKEQLAGKNKNDAELILSSLGNDVEKYEVEIGPFYIKNIPSKTDKITIDKITWDQYNTAHPAQ
ncbi:MAG TPA: hypothetical protein PKL83_00250 [bacterium]|nr:hypothetical protein [bacterium]